MNQTIKNVGIKTGIKFGIILAIYYLIFDVILFIIDPINFTKPVIGIVNWIVFTLLGITAIFITKRKLNNFISLREAFTPFLIMITIGFCANILVQTVLFNVVNPEAKIEANLILLDNVETILKQSDLTPDEINEKLEESRKYDSFSIDTLIFSLFGSILRASLAGIIIALIFRNKSEFTTNTQPKS